MKRHLHPARAVVLACLVWAFAAALLVSVYGQTQGTKGAPPPAKRPPESGLPRGGPTPTTKPGSHESSARDERDRIVGKFPAPKESEGGGDERRGDASVAAGTTAYVDVVVLDGQRQALTVGRDDFQVRIDNEPRRVVAAHYVFRGPQALEAGKSIPVGNAVVARGDEQRTLVVVVDEDSFAREDESAIGPAVRHVLDLVGPSDRSALVALPQPASIAFVTDRGVLLNRVAGMSGRAPATPGPAASLDGLVRVLNDLMRFAGPKQVLLFEGGARGDVAGQAEIAGQSPAIDRVLIAAAASRSTVHLVTAPGAFAPPWLPALARSTGGTATRLTGEPRDLEPLAAVLLGGYVLQVESRASDRDGRAHELAVTTTRRAAHVLAAARWMPHRDPLPGVIVH